MSISRGMASSVKLDMRVEIKFANQKSNPGYSSSWRSGDEVKKPCVVKYGRRMVLRLDGADRSGLESDPYLVPERSTSAWR